jgi:hypothetical protein
MKVTSHQLFGFEQEFAGTMLGNRKHQGFAMLQIVS